MKRSHSLLWVCLSAVFFAACSDGNFNRTKTGLMYKIISDKKNPVVKNGQVLKFEYRQTIHDSVLYSSLDNGPAFVPIDSTTPLDYNPSEVFALLRKGDSAVIVIEADTIKKKSGQLPPFLKPKDKVFLMIRVKDVFANVEAADSDRQGEIKKIMEKQQKEAEIQKKKDLVILGDYLKAQGITAQTAPKGTLVEVTTPGTGMACDSGKYVSVMYTGKTLSGNAFDSNVDTTFGHAGQPYTFMIGSTGSIAGWDDGLRLFKKGGKGRLYIPSSMAYGKQGAPPRIKPNENLIFDVEIVDVTDKMPQPNLPGAPSKGK